MLKDIACYALQSAIREDHEMLSANLAYLDNGQLRALINAARLLTAAANDELTGRES